MWVLFADAGARVITATDAKADNVRSRQVLEKPGFVPVDEDNLHVSYLRDDQA